MSYTADPFFVYRWGPTWRSTLLTWPRRSLWALDKDRLQVSFFPPGDFLSFPTDWANDDCRIENARRIYFKAPSKTDHPQRELVAVWEKLPWWSRLISVIKHHGNQCNKRHVLRIMHIIQFYCQSQQQLWHPTCKCVDQDTKVCH